MTENSKPKILIVAGPTASGKTNLARFLAEKFNGEIVSADSRQVYRGLDIGTGKEGVLSDQPVKDSSLNKTYPVKRYIDTIPQWLVDIADPAERFTVADWQQQAYTVIDDILARQKLPIVVGGTGLYIAGLVGGYDFRDVDRDSKNSRHADSSTYQKDPPNWEVLQLALDLPREELYQRIDKRLHERIEEGLIEEGQRVLDQLGEERLRQFGLEYRYLADLLTGFLNRDLFESRLATAIHQYARRQLTWFRKFGNVVWVANKEEALKAATNFIAN